MANKRRTNVFGIKFKKLRDFESFLLFRNMPLPVNVADYILNELYERKNKHGLKATKKTEKLMGVATKLWRRWPAEVDIFEENSRAWTKAKKRLVNEGGLISLNFYA